MKYFALLLAGFIYASSAQALMLNTSQMTNHGEFVPYNCEVWNDGCNDCEKTDSGYVCPPKNCATTRMGYCRVEKETLEPVVSPSAPQKLEEPLIPETCTSWFDGCNTCEVSNGELTFCTEMACSTYAEPTCRAYAAENLEGKTDNLNIVRPGAPAEVLLIIENGELIEPKASLWGLIKYHLFGWMK